MPRQTFQARFEQLEKIREFVGLKARASGFSDKAIYSVQLAADEAASNIIEHAYEGHPEGTFEVECESEGAQLIITFRDQGKSFDFDSAEKPDLLADLSKRKIGGLGIYLMHKLMDKVEYKITPAGNTLTLTKQKE
jgi:serine/threonine-protein kinase RsbW